MILFSCSPRGLLPSTPPIQPPASARPERRPRPRWRPPEICTALAVLTDEHHHAEGALPHLPRASRVHLLAEGRSARRRRRRERIERALHLRGGNPLGRRFRPRQPDGPRAPLRLESRRLLRLPQAPTRRRGALGATSGQGSVPAPPLAARVVVVVTAAAAAAVTTTTTTTTTTIVAVVVATTALPRSAVMIIRNAQHGKQ